MLEILAPIVQALITAGPWGIATLLVLMVSGLAAFIAWVGYMMNISLLKRQYLDCKSDKKSMARIIERNTDAFVRHSEVITVVTATMENSNRMIERVHDRLDKL